MYIMETLHVTEFLTWERDSVFHSAGPTSPEKLQVIYYKKIEHFLLLPLKKCFFTLFQKYTYKQHYKLAMHSPYFQSEFHECK